MTNIQLPSGWWRPTSVPSPLVADGGPSDHAPCSTANPSPDSITARAPFLDGYWRVELVLITLFPIKHLQALTNGGGLGTSNQRDAGISKRPSSRPIPLRWSQMKTTEVLQAWRGILVGRKPSLSIEITKECPLRCPGCYAFDPAHLGGKSELRQLSDFKGDLLVRNILAIVDREKPLHLSLVGGDPLVRYREVELLLPQLEKRGVHTQIVTSAFRVIPIEWNKLTRLNIVVSIDGLQADHDERRKPATYERILKNIAGTTVTIHSTITGNIAARPGYLEEFLKFWSSRPEINKVWFSLFTPQRGAVSPEILTPEQRSFIVADLLRLRVKYSILDMHESLIREMLRPPPSPATCIFARTTQIISADLKTKITPCQFGGDPDCRQCGCIASMGLAAVGHHRVLGRLTAGHLFRASDRVGMFWRKAVGIFRRPPAVLDNSTFRILQN